MPANAAANDLWVWVWYDPKMFRRLFLVVQSALFVVGLQGQAPIRFSANVRSHENYTHPIGHGLYFVLEQSDGGDWNFAIRPSPASDENFTQCLGSPVMHGPGTVDLTAWRFAPDADAGWAEKLPVTKQFDFVTNGVDQKYECANQDAMYASFQRSQSAGLTPDYDGLPDYKPRAVGHGKVVIQSVSLRPGLSGNDAEFDSVTLQVVVTFPGGKRAKRR